MFLSKIILNEGFELTGEARKFEQVMSCLEENPPDLVLMDIGISGSKDGIETAEIIQQKYSIPIIFITGNSDESTLENAKKVNPIDFIFKPIDELRLRRKLADLKSI